jgi:nucleotide-binding universal stress UspA family protein
VLPIRNILFGTDFSEPAAYAFSLAAALARDAKARLIVAHVREVVAAVGEFGALPPVVESEEEAKKKLVALYPADPTIEVKYVLTDGPPAPELLRLAELYACDLIVVGSHGRTGLLRMLMGSIAERVVRGAKCPTLVVKRPVAEAGGETKAKAKTKKTAV